MTNSNLDTTSETTQLSQPDEVVTQKAANDDSEAMNDIPVLAIDPALSRSNPDTETNDLIRDSTTASKSKPDDVSSPPSVESSSAARPGGKKKPDSGQSPTISAVTDPTDVATMPLNTGDEYSEILGPDKNNTSEAEEVKSVTKETDIFVTEETSSISTVGGDKTESNSGTPSSDPVKVSEILDNNVESPTVTAVPPTPSPVSNQPTDEMSGKVTATVGKRPANSNNSISGLKSQDASLQSTTGSSLMVDERDDTGGGMTETQLGIGRAPSSGSVNDIVMTQSSVGKMNDNDGSQDENQADETRPRVDGQTIKPVTSRTSETVGSQVPLNNRETFSTSLDNTEADSVTVTKTTTTTTLTVTTSTSTTSTTSSKARTAIPRKTPMTTSTATTTTSTAQTTTILNSSTTEITDSKNEGSLTQTDSTANVSPGLSEYSSTTGNIQSDKNGGAKADVDYLDYLANDSPTLSEYSSTQRTTTKVVQTETPSRISPGTGGGVGSTSPASVQPRRDDGVIVGKGSLP